MSLYITVEVDMTDQACLVAALEDLGYKVEQHDKAVPLHGYQGDIRKQKANVIVRRQYLNACSNDVGFEKTAKGNFVMHMSEYDESLDSVGQNFKFRLKQFYSKHKALKTVKNMRGMITSQKTDSSDRLHIRIRMP